MSTEQPNRALNRARVAAMSVLLLLLFGATSFAVRGLPRGAAGFAAAFVAGLLVTPFPARDEGGGEVARRRRGRARGRGASRHACRARGS